MLAGTHWISLLILLHAASLNAQNWTLEASIRFTTDTSSGDHLVLDLDSGILACARSSTSGGVAKIYGRNNGGLHQWESFRTFASDVEGFAYAIDLDAPRLALATKRGQALEAERGVVDVYELDPVDGAEPAVPIGHATPVDDLERDGYGHNILLSGDHLYVGATGRSHPKGSGAVHVHRRPSGSAGAWTEVALIQPAAAGFELPFMQQFGAQLSVDGDHLFVASPASGYSANMRCGALHAFIKEPLDDVWTEVDHWFDASSVLTVDPETQQSFYDLHVNDLARTGLMRSGSVLLADWSLPYRDELSWWVIPEAPPETPACASCRLRAFEHGPDGELSEGPTWPQLEPTAERGYRSWAVGDGILAYNVLSSGSWETLSFVLSAGNELEPLMSIPALEEDLVYTGPLRVSNGLLARSGYRVVDPDSGDREFMVEIFALDVDIGIRPQTTVQPVLRVWPSPCAGACSVEFERQGPWSLEVWATDGSLVKGPLMARGGSVDLSGLQAGFYLLRASDARQSRTVRLTVQ